MLFELDHIVHFIGSNGEEILPELKKLNLKSITGGVHTEWGTANILSYAGLSYVEYLFIRDEEKASASNNPLIKLLVGDLKEREGFGQLCFRCDDIHKVKIELKEKGYQTGDLIEGKRTQHDGKILKWKMLFMDEKPKSGLPWPFFIQWDESSQDRKDRLKRMGAISSENENRSIQLIRMASRDPGSDMNEWKKAFGLEEGKVESEPYVLNLNGTLLIFEHPNELNIQIARPFALQFSPCLFPGTIIYRGAAYQ
ncbi:VOC family protein [Falsibacillus pallidus]|uniref:Glyoxalase-like protein n=1 Tax=Falsibacillus pallidus TaxID=493781 RepID=A0A370GIY9_9BACI|nr:VOC family protein [Falsibacillus pallidus]RDI43179.1 glyoxalase-like protein [Falsibacillus pallidus]